MKLDKVVADARRWGWTRSLLTHALARIRRYTGLDVYHIFVRDLQRPACPAQHVPDGITVRIARSEELVAAAEDPDLDMDPEVIRKALARGDIAFGAFHGKKLVAYTWRAFKACPHKDGLWAQFEAPYLYQYHSHTKPSFRGKRIQLAVSNFSDDYALARGYSAIVAFTDVSNFSSLAMHEVAGEQGIGYAGYVKWFGRSIPYRTPAVKKVGFRFERLSAR